MGNSFSNRSCSSGKSRERTRKVFFLLHRTWAIIVTDKWTKTRFSKTVDSRDFSSDLDSQYSFCSCSQCYHDDHLSFSSSSRYVQQYDSLFLTEVHKYTTKICSNIRILNATTSFNHWFMLKTFLLVISKLEHGEILCYGNTKWYCNLEQTEDKCKYLAI